VAYPNPPPPPFGGCIFGLAMIAVMALCGHIMLVASDQVSRGKRTECPLRSGEIHLRTGEGSIFGCVSRGDCPSFERMVGALVDATLSPSAETIVATRVTRLSA
jgi:hypothetical protein